MKKLTSFLDTSIRNLTYGMRKTDNSQLNIQRLIGTFLKLNPISIKITSPKETDGTGLHSCLWLFESPKGVVEIRTTELELPYSYFEIDNEGKKHNPVQILDFLCQSHLEDDNFSELLVITRAEKDERTKELGERFRAFLYALVQEELRGSFQKIIFIKTNGFEKKENAVLINPIIMINGKERMWRLDLFHLDLPISNWELYSVPKDGEGEEYYDASIDYLLPLPKELKKMGLNLQNLSPNNPLSRIFKNLIREEVIREYRKDKVFSLKTTFLKNIE